MVAVRDRDRHGRTPWLAGLGCVAASDHHRRALSVLPAIRHCWRYDRWWRGGYKCVDVGRAKSEITTTAVEYEKPRRNGAKSPGREGSDEKPPPRAPNIGDAGLAVHPAVQARANARAADLAPIVAELQAAGAYKPAGHCSRSERARRRHPSRHRPVAGEHGRAVAGAVDGLRDGPGLSPRPLSKPA
jgi:hypothetical protein